MSSLKHCVQTSSTAGLYGWRCRTQATCAGLLACTGQTLRQPRQQSACGTLTFRLTVRPGTHCAQAVLVLTFACWQAGSGPSHAAASSKHNAEVHSQAKKVTATASINTHVPAVCAMLTTAVHSRCGAVQPCKPHKAYSPAVCCCTCPAFCSILSSIISPDPIHLAKL